MNISEKAYRTLNYSWWTLKLTYGLLYVVAGADKFTNIIVHWPKYLQPALPLFFGVTERTFMMGVGIIEIIIGLLVLSRYTRVGAMLVAIWFFLIVLNLLSLMTYFDIAVRDIVMAIGSLVLVALTCVKDEVIAESSLR